MIWTKGAHQSAKIQTFDCSRKISPNLYFDTLLIVYKILSKKYIRVISHGSEDWCKIWRKTYLFYKNDKNLVKFDLSTCKSPNLHFHLLLLCKVFNVWPRKVQRSYLSWHWRVIRNSKKNWLVVGKMTWGIWEIFTRALETLKIGILMWSLNPK